MPKAAAPRTPDERAAHQTKRANLATGLRADVADLTAAVAALPAPASRTPAQRRDALVLRTLIRLIRLSMLMYGLAQADDLTDEPA